MTLPINVLLNHTKRQTSKAVWRKLPCGHRIKVAKNLKGTIRCPKCSPIVVIRHE